MKIENYSIEINFILLDRQVFIFNAYRMECDDLTKPKPNETFMQYSLPVSPTDSGNRKTYWISFTNTKGLEQVSVNSEDNRLLTVRFLHHVLAQSSSKCLEESEYIIENRGFLKEIHFVLNHYPEGKECVSVQPYYLRINDEFGFLLDYSFKQDPDIPFSRKIQRLSLSLDENYRSNKNFYSDRFKKIAGFLNHEVSKIFPLKHHELEGSITISEKFTELSASLLDTKTYVFNNDREKNSQFLGVKEFGPLFRPKYNPTFIFIFREEDTELARYLLRSLRGQIFPYQFPGMHKMFNIDFSNTHINHFVIPAYNREALTDVLAKIAEIASPVPVLVVPGEKDAYYLQKSLFTNCKISSQCITRKILRDERQFKWAVANIGLQIFCKAGGRPWLVKPTDSRCLIIGISQTHLREPGEDYKIKKYFAYSVLTDSSGVFQRLSVLARGDDKNTYLKELKYSVIETVKANSAKFDTIVIHTSFKIRRDELDVIKEAIKGLENGCRSTDIDRHGQGC
jgi:hypothetical protein